MKRSWRSFKPRCSKVASRVPVLTGVAEYDDRPGLQVRRRRSQGRRRWPDGAAGHGLQVGSARNHGPFRAVAARQRRCRSCATTTRSPTASTSRPPMFAELADEPKFVAIKESSENVRRITDLKNVVRRPLPAVLRRRRPGAGKRHARRGRLGLGPGQRLSAPRIGCCGIWPRPGKLEEALKVYRWYTPLLHLDTHIKLVQYIKLAMAETGLGSEMVRGRRGCRWSGANAKRCWRSSARRSRPARSPDEF